MFAPKRVQALWASTMFGSVSLISTRRFGEPVGINPFDDDNGNLLGFGTNEERHNLWPAFADFPVCERSVRGGADHAT